MEPENSGNIGAIARVMKNFGFSRLVLIDPKVKIDSDAKNRAKHAQDVLRNATIADKKILNCYDQLIATTAKTGTDYNVNRSPLSSREFATHASKNAGLLIGREGIGLTNDEIEMCHIVVTIPASSKYATLNISHALAILLYELSAHKLKDIELASKKDMDILRRQIEESVERTDYAKNRKAILKKIWHRVMGKAALTKREAFALIGFFKK